MSNIHITPRFVLHVESGDSSAVWPYLPKADHSDRDLIKRIEEGYFADEDSATASLEISDLDDLRRILEFYKDRRIDRMNLVTVISMDELDVNASMSSGVDRRSMGSIRFKEKENLSPEVAASKIEAITSALKRWASSKQHE